MFDYHDFTQVFGSDPFVDRSQATEAEGLRKGLDGALFIDRVLKALGITRSKIYPPKTDTALRNLHMEVCEANMSVHHRLSIFFYALLDLTPQRHQAADVAVVFAAKSGLPRRYQTFMRGLYYLDKHQFNRSLEFISHPSLIPDFSDDIIIVLALNATATPNADYALVLNYFTTVQPVVKSSRALDLLLTAMARTSVSQALGYSRTYSGPTRKLLFGKLISAVLGADGSKADAASAAELVSAVLDADEEQWFEQYLTHGDGKALKKARDTIVMRKLVTGRYQEAVAERGVSSQWGGVLEGVKNGLGGRV
ncbi:Protein ELYS [Ceratocystis fimbriata CBS 114723]|uniref:Protein ELYS n=1 Tax=Ceratocystis fimbriata CBS 114723 TaxID=1035309 RepID=A0A2C5X503_9PEZI|nr:Protein ELYS [Ceratocystis fimbriata CBS 114723]